MRSVRTRLCAAMIAAGLSGPQAFACGFDGLLGDAFSAQHPKSLNVAMAVADAVSSGALGKGALTAIEPGQKGYWRAMARLQRFSALVSAAAEGAGRRPAISVLLIDSGLWTRLRPEHDGYKVEAHATGPVPGDVIVVTNEFVLASLDEGSLAPLRAFDLGLVAVDGEEALAATVQFELIARIDPAKRPGSAGGIAPAWGRRPSGS
ncbi:MAG: hypothetical protein K2Y29_01325 [Beijerinckiaceae bacterium]|nr:hypothetical protein [Beijerinckiaceae bacterium]